VPQEHQDYLDAMVSMALPVLLVYKVLRETQVILELLEHRVYLANMLVWEPLVQLV
jgi:hypothetical protein